MMKKLIATVVVMMAARGAVAADIPVMLPTKAPPPAPSAADWTGFYVGGHLGYAWGNSNFMTAPGLGGALDFYQSFDAFKDTGSYFAGLQAGYDYMLPNRFG